MYVSASAATWEGHESTVYEIPSTPGGAFWAVFRRLFDDALDNARSVWTARMAPWPQAARSYGYAVLYVTTGPRGMC